MEWSRVRISETCGPGDMRLLKLFRGIRKGRFPILGNGENLHQLIYVDDLSSGMLAACTSPASRRQTVLWARSEKITTNEMIVAVGEAVGSKKSALRAPMWPFVLAAL